MDSNDVVVISNTNVSRYHTLADSFRKTGQNVMSFNYSEEGEGETKKQETVQEEGEEREASQEGEASRLNQEGETSRLNKEHLINSAIQNHIDR